VIAWPQTPPLKSAAEVLERYRQAIGGLDVIKKVQSETRHGELEETGMNGKATFVGYAKPFLQLNKITLPDGREVLSGLIRTRRWNPRAATPICNTSSTSRVISGTSSWPARSILRAAAAIGFTA
jgi:hypothetical protein